MYTSCRVGICVTYESAVKMKLKARPAGSGENEPVKLCAVGRKLQSIMLFQVVRAAATSPTYSCAPIHAFIDITFS